MAEGKNPFEGFNILSNSGDLKPESGPLKEIPKAEIKTEGKTEEEEELGLEEEIETTDEVELKIREAKAAALKAIEEAKNPKATPKAKEEEEEDDASPIRTYAEHMASKGLLIEVPEDFDDSEEALEELQYKTIMQGIEEYKNSIPDEGKRFLEYLEAGGNPNKYIETFYGKSSISDLDLNEESNQKLVVAKGLKLLDYSEEEITEAIEEYELSGILDKQAKRFQDKLAKLEDKEKQAEVENQKLAAKKQAEEHEAYLQNLEKDIIARKDIAGFQLTEPLKKKLYEHITKPVDKKTGASQLMINNEKNPDAKLLYAYLDMIGWDLSKLEKSAETKAASKLRQNLGRYTDSSKKISSGKSEINQPSDFSAFRTVFKQ